MTFNDMITRFQSILNRDDCTSDQAAIYLQDAISRVAREARLPNMERLEQFTVSDQPLQFIPIPPDLIEIIDVYVVGCPDGSDDRALNHMPYSELLRVKANAQPIAYGRLQGALYVRGNVPQGGSVQLLYYGEFSDFATADSENEISASNPDLVVYGALSFAADAYDHPSADKWEARYQQILTQVQGLGIDLDSKGGPSAIRPMYQE